MEKSKEYEKMIKSIENVCVAPVKGVLEICSIKDSNANKIMAIKFYCAKVLTQINKHVEEALK